jgi:hypothetical protein
MKIERVVGGPEKFKRPIIDMLRKARLYVDMSSSFYPPFYNDVEIKDAIKDCVQRVFFGFRLLLDKETNIDTLKEESPWIFKLRDENPEKIQIARAKGEIEHWLIIDGKYIRLEGRHRPGEPGMKNLIVEDPLPIIIRHLQMIYNSWWKNAEKMNENA